MDKLMEAEKKLIEAEAFLRSHVVKTAADDDHWCSDCRAYCAAVNDADQQVEKARSELIGRRVMELG